MADNTKIEWADATVNAINGCSVTSPGCTHCYAMKLAGTRMKTHPTRAGLTVESKAGPVWNGEVRLLEPALLQPLAWKKPRRIFWNAHGDTFHDAVPDEWIDRIFAVAALTPQHTHMILTKRSARMRNYVTRLGRMVDASRIQRVTLDDPHAPFFAVLAPKEVPAWPLPNVWLGVSVEDQTRADERIPDLLATPAAVRFLSCEPLLGPVDLNLQTKSRDADPGNVGTQGDDPRGGGRSAVTSGEAGPSTSTEGLGPRIDWVIAGGESGPSARPMHPDWARSLRDQCDAAGAPFHFKQWGEWRIADCELGAAPKVRDRDFWRVGKKRAGRLLDGVEHNGMPA